MPPSARGRVLGPGGVGFFSTAPAAPRHRGPRRFPGSGSLPAVRWLLVGLTLAAVPLPLNSLWFFWMAQADTGAWIPQPFVMQSYRVVLHTLVLLVVVHRWRLARRGAPVQGLAGTRAVMTPGGWA